MVERPLRILQVSTVDLKGGAEKVAWNLFSAYRARGYPSWLAVGQKQTEDSDVLILPNQQLRRRWYHFFRRIACRLQQIDGNLRRETVLSRLAGGVAEPVRRLKYHLGLEDFDFPGTSQLLTLTGKPTDILHAHNLHGEYFDLRMLPWLSTQVPLLMTLHDAWLLSGHCAHSFDCEKWKTGCGTCPDLTIYPETPRDATAHNWRYKREIYSRSRVYVATPSRWLMEKVQKSMLAPAVIDARILPNGVDLKMFRPADKQAARAQLDIRDDFNVLLAVGVSITKNRWKDFRTLRAAITRVAEHPQRRKLLLIALGEEAPVERMGDLEIRFLPFQRDPEVAKFYQAADLYVHAALADTFPNTVLEAQACGTPVIATRVGGIPEQIENGRTGFLVPPADSAALGHRIAQLLADDQLRHGMGLMAAKHARDKFDLDRQVDAYLNWYHQITSHDASASSTMVGRLPRRATHTL